MEASITFGLSLGVYMCACSWHGYHVFEEQKDVDLLLIKFLSLYATFFILCGIVCRVFWGVLLRVSCSGDLAYYSDMDSSHKGVLINKQDNTSCAACMEEN